jgi:multidrug efflux pump
VAHVEVGPRTTASSCASTPSRRSGSASSSNRRRTRSTSPRREGRGGGLRATLPAGVRFDAAFDTSVFIERSLRDVSEPIFEAIALVVVVIFLFLRSLRATLIPSVAIPISLIGTFAVLHFVGRRSTR